MQFLRASFLLSFSQQSQSEPGCANKRPAKLPSMNAGAAVMRLALLRDIMNCTVGFVSCFCKFSWLGLAAWHKTAGLVYQWNSEKTVSQPHCIVSFRLLISHISVIGVMIFIGVMVKMTA